MWQIVDFFCDEAAAASLYSAVVRLVVRRSLMKYQQARPAPVEDEILSSYERFSIRNLLPYKYWSQLREQHSIEILSSTSTQQHKPRK